VYLDLRTHHRKVIHSEGLNPIVGVKIARKSLANGRRSVFGLFLWHPRIFNNLRSFVFDLFWPIFPQPIFVFNNFLALFLKKSILFL
jgi:hypothetical protein